MSATALWILELTLPIDRWVTWATCGQCDKYSSSFNLVGEDRNDAGGVMFWQKEETWSCISSIHFFCRQPWLLTYLLTAGCSSFQTHYRPLHNTDTSRFLSKSDLLFSPHASSMHTMRYVCSPAYMPRNLACVWSYPKMHSHPHGLFGIKEWHHQRMVFVVNCFIRTNRCRRNRKLKEHG